MAVCHQEQATFLQHGHQYARRLVEPDVLGRFCAAIERQLRGGDPGEVDPHAPGVYSVYASAATDALLDKLCAPVSSRIGMELLPTFSYLRIYEIGQSLPLHVDRAECEVTVTLTVDYKSDALWPLYLMAEDRIVDVKLDRGDALIFDGTKLRHWRRPFAGKTWTQVTFHYVLAAGKNASARFDRRKELNIA
jgi:hypothetical protein